MIAAHLEPHGLDPDVAPIADFYCAGNDHADAARGSRRLLGAIQRLQRKSKPKIKFIRPAGQARTWDERKLAFVSIRRVQQAVAEHFGTTVAALTGKRGPKSLVDQRHLAMYLARGIVKSSYPDIGRCFGGRDHSTVIHACRLVAEKPELEPHAKVLRERLSAA